MPGIADECSMGPSTAVVPPWSPMIVSIRMLLSTISRIGMVVCCGMWCP